MQRSGWLPPSPQSLSTPEHSLLVAAELVRRVRNCLCWQHGGQLELLRKCKWHHIVIWS